MVEVERVDGPEQRADALAVREAVFVEEQGVDPDIEYDEHDDAPDTTHLVAYRDDEPVGAARLRPYGPDTAKVERVAVLAAHRQTGVGRALMDRIHALARERGFGRAYLHAQTAVREFYAAAGYEPVGEVFEEADIPHIAMERKL